MQGITPPGPEIDVGAQDAFVRALARRLMRDEAAADDLAQETWLRVLGKSDVIVASPRSWLRRIVRQLAVSTLRANAARSDRERRAAALPSAPSPGELVDERRARARLAQALRGLSASQREVILLRYFEELPPRAIAARLGLPVETVRTRLKRALEALRVRFDGAARDEGGNWLAGLVAFCRALRAPSERSSVAWGAAAAAVLVACSLFVFSPRAKNGSLASTIEAPPPLALPPVAERHDLATATRDGSAAPSAEATTSELRPGHGELAVAFFEADSSRPAGLVQFELSTLELRDLAPRTAAADAGGHARLELESGTWRLAAARGRPEIFSIRAGDCTELSIVLPRSVTVTGAVLDAGGYAIGSATVYVTPPFRTDEVAKAVSTDAAGRFRLEDVDPSSWIGATAEHCIDGDLLFLDDPAWAEAPTREVELVLEPANVNAAGRVTDRDGRPIAGAIVQPVLNTGGMLWRTPLTALVEPSPIQDARVTDEDGCFSLADLVPCPWDLVVTAPGHAPVLRVFHRDPSQGPASTINIALDAGCSVRGRALLPNGRPAQDAEVSLGGGGSLGRYVTRTDAEGRFSMERLPRVELRGLVFVVDEGSPYTAAARLDGMSGDEHEWDVEMSPGGVVAGSWSLPDGRPARGILVSLRKARSRSEEWIPNEHPTKASWTVTDEGGGFAFESCPPVPHRLDVWEEVAGGLRHLDSADAVLPDPVARSWTLRPTRSSLAGSFRDETEANRVRAALWLNHLSWTHPRRIPVDKATGRFDVEDLCESSYTLFVWRPGGAPQRWRTVTLGPGEHRELEPIVIAPPGGLLVRLPEDLGPVRDGLELSLCERTESGAPRMRASAHLRLEAGTSPVLIEHLLPGDYDLNLGGNRRALVRVPVVVESGRTTEVAPELQPCASGWIEVILRTGGGQSRLHLDLFDAEGRTSARIQRPTSDAGGPADRLRIPVELPIGRYRFRAYLIGTEREASGAIDVERVGPVETLAVIEL